MQNFNQLFGVLRLQDLFFFLLDLKRYHNFI